MCIHNCLSSCFFLALALRQLWRRLTRLPAIGWLRVDESGQFSPYSVALCVLFASIVEASRSASMVDFTAGFTKEASRAASLFESTVLAEVAPVTFWADWEAFGDTVKTVPSVGSSAPVEVPTSLVLGLMLLVRSDTTEGAAVATVPLECEPAVWSFPSHPTAFYPIWLYPDLCT